jgi:beta-lactamase regulating signal transducer with metallopeptidase domain
MIDWLIDTLVWTGALIALVLLVRRPVARHLGAQAAYMLWLLPFARLFVPAIELPAAFAPEAAPAPMVAIDPVMLMAMQAQPAPQPDTSWLWFALAIGAWLTGAIVMLGWRYLAYFRMRARLLEHAEEKLRIGGVRIVESGATESPLAFGIVDKVIAVPAMFLETADTRTRNLAIAHEMAHHERGDLIANFAAQPLFALHWFNPLGWLGWRALRRDQEAACDARVVSDSDDDTRAAYAQTIARFSAGPDLALAAPMACPVLGEKSIIERLRSLSMADISPRRRWAGRAALATGLLALPLTASFTYAAPNLAGEDIAIQDGPAGADTIVIREVDPDAAPLTEEEVEALEAQSEALEKRAEAVAEAAEELESEMRVVFMQDGKVVSEKEFEARAEKLERKMAALHARKLDDIKVDFDLDGVRVVDRKKLVELEKLGKQMARLEVRIEQDPQWQVRREKLQNAALEIAEIQMPRMVEVQRDLAQKGLLGECKKDGDTIACSQIDIGKLQRDAIAEARREIKRDRDLSDAERKRALKALDLVMPEN